jgi:hypothetical protein
MGAAKEMLTSALFLAVSINLFFVVLWEVGFYFLYITKREDDIAKNMAYNLVDLFTSELWQVVSAIPLVLRKPLLDQALAELNSVSAATAKDDGDKKERDAHNRKLMYYALGMCGGFLLLVVIFGIMCGVRKIFPDQKHMWLELFVVMAGFIAFDFFFFDYIVKNFQPVSPGKFQRLLLQPTLDNVKCFPMQALPHNVPTQQLAEQAESRLLQQAAGLLGGAASLADLAAPAALLREVVQVVRSGSPPPTAPPPPVPPPTTPSMEITPTLKTALGDITDLLQSLAQQVSVASTLTSHFGYTAKKDGVVQDISGWLGQVVAYLGAAAAALQQPTAGSIEAALQDLPSMPQRPT